MHVCPDPHPVPSGWKVRSVHSPPVLHSMVAVAAHGFVEVQVAPSVQLMQAPAGEHTCPGVPHGVPGAWKVRSVHRPPVLHSMVAVAAQAFVEVQVAPSVQLMQAPAGEHTCPVPQAVPGALKVRSVHRPPVLHSMVAVASHGFVEVQVAPWLQAPQTPVGEQTRFVPQLVPGALKVLSVHTGNPELHSMVAVTSQGFVEVQVAPWLQALVVKGLVRMLDQAPTLGTRKGAEARPSAAKALAVMRA